MARYSYLFEYPETLPGPTAVVVFHRSTFSCIPRVAKFFEIKSLQYVPNTGDLVDRAGYTRSYTKADETEGTLTVPAGKKVYTAYGKANAKIVTVKTGRNAQGKRKTLTFTFPSSLGVANIADALGELLPPAKVASIAPATPVQIEPFFTIKGGNTYPLPTSAEAEATPFPNLAKTPAEEITVLARTVSKPKPKPNPSPSPTP